MKKKEASDGRFCTERGKDKRLLAASISRQMIPVKQTAAVVEAQVRIGRTGTGKKSAVQPTGLSKFFNYLPPNILDAPSTRALLQQIFF